MAFSDFRNPDILEVAKILYKADRDMQMGISPKHEKPKMAKDESKPTGEKPFSILLDGVEDDLEVVYGEVSSQSDEGDKRKIEVLWRLAKRMSDYNYIPNRVAVDADGNSVHATDSKAVKWNLIGHIHAMSSNSDEAEDIFSWFEDLHTEQCDEDRHYGRSRYFGDDLQSAIHEVGSVIHMLQNPYFYA